MLALGNLSLSSLGAGIYSGSSFPDKTHTYEAAVTVS